MNWFARVLGFGLASAAIALGIVLAILGENLRHVVLATPWWLLLLAVPILAMGIRASVWPEPATMRFSRKRSLDGVGRGFAAHLADLPDGLRLGAVLLLIFACARPQSTRMTERIEHQGIDIAIVLDLSESMATEDLRPNRLTAAKLVIDDFIARRNHDRIALVGFGANASTIAPLTMDHAVLRNLVGQVRLGVLNGRQTAMGAGLGLALNRLDASDAKSQVIVLLTDGVHNGAGLDPDSVAQKAAQRGVKIYTVLMGERSVGNASLDADQLERLASATEGFAYVAEDIDALQTSFQDLLNKLEKSDIEGERIYAELFPWLLWPVLILLGLDVALRNTRLRRFP